MQDDSERQLVTSGTSKKRKTSKGDVDASKKLKGSKGKANEEISQTNESVASVLVNARTSPQRHNPKMGSYKV